MRHVVNRPEGEILTWLLSRDQQPSILPEFPVGDKGLVVATLIGDRVIAEVIPRREDYVLICGPGVPLGRVYFQIDKSDLYSTCPGLTADAFSPG